MAKIIPRAPSSGELETKNVTDTTRVTINVTANDTYKSFDETRAIPYDKRAARCEVGSEIDLKDISNESYNT